MTDKANGRKPDFIIRMKEAPESTRWVTAGAAWKFSEEKGEGYAVRMNVLPTQFDGTFIMVPPLENEEKKNS